MNSSSKIEISKSSLLSLKAEILRKQQEVNKAKIVQSSIQQTQTPLRGKSKVNASTSENNEPQNKGIESRQANDVEEDMDLLRKSRQTLEHKTKLYNRLVKGPGNLTNYEIEMNKHYLVQFDRKENTEAKVSSSEEEHFSDEYDPPDNPDEEWIEYTDCLGRTRKCLRKDLEFLKEKDTELSKTLGSDGKISTKEAPQWIIDTKGDNINKDKIDTTIKPTPVTKNNEMLSSDMRRELLREEWEKQEYDLMNKTDIHYQDILFNEARSHGVGYYAFSNDEEQRAKQQAELKKLRKETTDKQKANLDQKAMREKQLAARLKAARNRKRARMGLPPEEDEPEEPAPTVQEEPINEEEERKVAEKAAEEKAREEERRKHIRAWDIGKEGIVPHYEYSQEEWVDKKRSERPKEFAPPNIYKHGKSRKSIDNEEEYSEQNKSLFFTSKKSKGKSIKKKSVNPYKDNLEANANDSEESNDNNDCIDFDDEQHLRNVGDENDEPKATSTYSSRNKNYYKSDDEVQIEDRNKTFQPTPIIDECSDDYVQYNKVKKPEIKPKRKGAEIAPPPTFDYYGPSTTKQQKTKTNANLEESIAAGLRFLREKAEFKQKHGGSRSDFENC